VRKYDSQGQARSESEARRPWLIYIKRRRGLKGRHSRRRIYALFRAERLFWFRYQGDVLASLALVSGYHTARRWRFLVRLTTRRQIDAIHRTPKPVRHVFIGRLNQISV